MPPGRRPAFWLAATASFFLGLATCFTLGAALLPASTEIPDSAKAVQPSPGHRPPPDGSTTSDLEALRRRIRELEVELAISRELGSPGPEVIETPVLRPGDTRPGRLVPSKTAATLTPPSNESETALLAEMLAPFPHELATRPDLLMVLFRHYLELGDEARAMVALAELQRQDVDESVFQSCLDYLPPHLRLPLLLDFAKQSKNDETWGDLGDLYTEMGNSDLAQEAYQQALLLDPSDEEWIDALASVAPWKVLEVLEQRVAENPGDLEASGVLSLAYYKSGRTSDAVALLERFLPEAPLDVITTMIKIDPSRAVQLIEERLRTSSQDRATGERLELDFGADYAGEWSLLGLAYQALGRQGEAAEAWWRALALEPANDDASQALRAHDASRLVSFYEQRLSDPEHATDDEIWGDLGDTFAHLGRESEALNCYQNARDLDREDGEWEEKVAEFSGNPSPNGDMGVVDAFGLGSKELDIPIPEMEFLVEEGQNE